MGLSGPPQWAAGVLSLSGVVQAPSTGSFGSVRNRSRWRRFSPALTTCTILIIPYHYLS
jgi:hypothetical protein